MFRPSNFSLRASALACPIWSLAGSKTNKKFLMAAKTKNGLIFTWLKAV